MDVTLTNRYQKMGIGDSKMIDSRSQNPFEQEIARFLVDNLRIEAAACDIIPDAPLYGEGLGLDSIDVLELSLAISKQYGFQLKSDDQNNKDTFSSLRSLATYIAKHRTK